jgi:hypothetical protein
MPANWPSGIPSPDSFAPTSNAGFNQHEQHSDDYGSQPLSTRTRSFLLAVSPCQLAL